MKKAGQYLIGLFLVFLLLPSMALAQRGVPITEKPRPDYDALGIRSGAFIIKPELTFLNEYNDNIYAVKNNTESDWIFVLAPKVDVRSQWSRHALEFNAGAKAGLYASESNEDYMDGHLFLSGRLDATRDSFITGRAGVERLHEERGAPDAASSWRQWDQPSVYYRNTGNLSYFQEFGKFAVTTGTGIASLDYKKVDLIDGTSASQSTRDRNTYNLSAKMAYDMNPNVSPFVTTRYEWRRYGQSNVERDSEGVRLGIGTGIDLGGLVSADIYGGYMTQDYDNRKDISGLWYGMSVLWNPTPLTSVQTTAETSIQETTVANAAGIEAFDFWIKADHELQRNLLIGAVAEYTRHDYEGVDISDKYFAVGPTLTYLWNRNLGAEVGFTRRVKDSNVSEREYTENRFTVALTGSF